MVKVPLTKKEMYENVILRPVKKKTYVIKLEFLEILKNEKTIYAIKEKCEEYNDIMICKENQIIDITNNTCIPNIINNRNS